MKTKAIIALAILALASCAPTDRPVADSKAPMPRAESFNPLDEPGYTGTVNFDGYSTQGRFAPNAWERRAVGLYGH